MDVLHAQHGHPLNGDEFDRLFEQAVRDKQMREMVIHRVGKDALHIASVDAFKRDDLGRFLHCDGPLRDVLPNLRNRPMCGYSTYTPRT